MSENENSGNQNQGSENKRRFDPNKTVSDLPGMKGFLDTMLKRFRNIGFMIALAPLQALFIIAIGASLTPGILLFQKVQAWTADSAFIVQALSIGMAIGAGFFLYGYTLIFVVPLLNMPIKPFVKPMRCVQFDIKMVPWYYHNGLTYLVRYTFLELITPTPMSLMFYKLMGMKCGKGVIINTTRISDPCLIQLDDYVTLGGSVTMFAHYGMQGFMVVDRVHIKRNTTIGLLASVMGGVTVGSNNIIPPHTALLPKTNIPDGERRRG